MTSDDAANRLAPIHHVGYVVDELSTAVPRFAAAFGTGPFFAMHHIRFDEVSFRDGPATYDHSSAFGAWGPMLVELTDDALVFNNAHFSGGYVGVNVGNPHLLGFNLGISGPGHDYPRVIFGVLVLVVTLAVALLVARLRNAPAGRMFIAVRSNERAAASIGVNVASTKLLAFGLSAFIAGIGGGLLAYQEGNINPASFTLWTSLTILAITYVGGVGRISGALAAGVLLASNGVVPTLLDKLCNFGQYQALIAGLALAITKVANPDGVAKELGAGVARLLGLFSRQRGPAGPVVPLAPASPGARPPSAPGSKLASKVLEP